MSRKITKSHLSRDEISLLRNSEEPKNTELYGNLYDIICNLNLKAISANELLNLNDLGNVAITRNKKALMEIANKEWVIERDSGEDPTQKIKCGLCNRPNRYIFYIRNRLNGTVLNVGSKCITNFPEIEGFTEYKKRINQMKKGQKIIQRSNEFHNHFPEYEDLIHNAEQYFMTLPILLPDSLYTGLQEVVERMRLICTKYINEGKKPFKSEFDSFKLFQLAIQQYNKLKSQADIHVSKNKENPLACKRIEIDWMNSHNKSSLLHKIAENDGIYTIDTLKYVWSVDYLQKHINLIFSKNQSELVVFDKFNGDNLLFAFNKFGYNPPVVFSIRLSDFMQHIGANCIINPNYAYNGRDILKISNIIPSESNLVSVLNYIDNIMTRLSCVFLIDDSTNSLFLYRKGDRSIRQFTYYNFLQAYSKYILASDEDIKKYLFTVVKGSNNVKWISPALQSQQGIDDKINRLYKAYKDAHEYDNYHVNDNKFEIVVYNIANDQRSNKTIVEFSKPEYITMQRNRLKIGNNQLGRADYAILIPNDSLEPLYHKGDIILIQIIQKIKDKSTIFFSYEEGFNIKECHTESQDPESIFKFIHVPKRKLQAYGQVIYCIRK